MNDLIRLDKLINELQQEPSKIMKENILCRYKDLKGILKIVYDPFIKFNIARKTLEEKICLSTLIIDKFSTLNIFPSLQHFLNYLICKNSNYSQDLINLCRSFLFHNRNYYETILRVLDKDLKCGISTKTINKIFPNLIPEFNVPLANKYEEGLCDFEKERWYLSRKLDGVRCLVFCENTNIRIFSRNGKEIYTLDILKNELLNILKNTFDNIIFDGELCVIDQYGNENFKSIISQFRRKDYTIPNPKLYIFDFYGIQEFSNNDSYSILSYGEKINFLKEFFKNSNKNIIEVLDQRLVASEEDFNYIPSNYEGFILRKEGPTLFKRSNNLLKVKNFKEDEFIVVGMERGFKVIDGVKQEICSSLMIQYKNDITFVGSGLSDKQRLEWLKDPSLILNKKITVKYFNESKNKFGGLSLRFPTLKRIWEE